MKNKKLIKLKRSFTTSLLIDGDVKRAVIKSSKECYILADKSKFNIRRFYTYGNFNEGIVITDKTPFYATMGGQAGDVGVITGNDLKADVIRCEKAPNGQTMHFVRIIKGDINKGDYVTLTVDKENRFTTCQNHTATHLLQRALKDVLGEEVGESGRNIQRFIRLTYLIPELLNLVDDKRIALRPAVELSYISADNQEFLYDIFKYDEATPTLGQAQLLRKLDEKGELTEDKLEDIMREEKPNQKEQFKTSYDNIRHYFPKNYSNEQINNKIMELLEKYQKEWKQKIRDSR